MSIEDYNLEKLGSGSFSQAFKGTKKGSQDCFFVMKINKDVHDKVVEDTLSEGLEVLKDINHPNIIKLLEIKQESKFLYLICEYYNGGDLAFYLKEKKSPLSEEVVQHIMKQLINAIKYLHEKKIVHRDIKPENIFINYASEKDLSEKNLLNSKIILGGFDVSTHLKQNQLLDLFVGTKGYISPEIEKGSYNEKVDIWSLGIVFTELLLGKKPFYPSGENKNKINYDLFKILSKEARAFIDCMLQEDPNNRKTAEELLKQDFLVKNIKDFNYTI